MADFDIYLDEDLGDLGIVQIKTSKKEVKEFEEEEEEIKTKITTKRDFNSTNCLMIRNLTWFLLNIYY